MSAAPQRCRLRQLLLTGATVAFGVLVLIVSAIYAGGLENADQVASVTAMFIGLAGLGLSARQLLLTLTERQTGAPTELINAVSYLARSVSEQWVRERELRALNHPEPIRLRWSEPQAMVPADPDGVLADAVPGRVLRLRLRGHLDEAADKYLRLPRRQLVVLGRPGAGKTVFALLLVLGLLERRGDDEPVPVLLGAASWNPVTESLATWTARRIAEEYPQLSDERLYGPDVARRLVDAGRILPVVDGLDELPPMLHEVAIRAIRAAGSTPIVLTCRSVEFATAVRGGGVLVGAAVVELQPVTPDELADYLEPGAHHVSAWQPVLEYLRTHPESAAADALSTPLMAGLARAIYTGGDPVELIDTERFPAGQAIEEHLLGRYIRIMYSPVPASARTPDTARAAWTADQAERWLRYLARHLLERGRFSFAWWRLYQAVPGPAATAAVVLVATLAGIVVTGGVVGPIVGWREALVAATTVGAANGLTAGLAARFGSIPGRPVRYTVRVGRTGGIAEAVRSVVIAALAPGLIVAVTAAVAVGPLVGVVSGLTLGVLSGLIAGLVRWSVPSDQATAVDPVTVLRDDRAAAVLNAGTRAVFAGGTALIVFGISYGPQAAVAAALAAGLSLGLGFSLGTAWVWYRVVHCWLCLRRVLPWRLMRFLGDAHRRGVLRQVGATYEFRHARLRDHLAGVSSSKETEQRSL